MRKTSVAGVQTCAVPASLSGATAGAGTSISFYLFAPSDDCSSLATAVYDRKSTRLYSSHRCSSTTGTDIGRNTTTQAGTYHWLAKYTGDANNADASSTCASEAVVIAANSPSLITTPNKTSYALSLPHALPTSLSGATAGAGTSISFYLFAPSDDCSSLATAV